MAQWYGKVKENTQKSYECWGTNTRHRRKAVHKSIKHTRGNYGAVVYDAYGMNSIACARRCLVYLKWSWDISSVSHPTLLSLFPFSFKWKSQRKLIKKKLKPIIYNDINHLYQNHVQWTTKKKTQPYRNSPEHNRLCRIKKATHSSEYQEHRNVHEPAEKIWEKSFHPFFHHSLCSFLFLLSFFINPSTRRPSFFSFGFFTCCVPILFPIWTQLQLRCLNTNLYGALLSPCFFSSLFLCWLART